LGPKDHGLELSYEEFLDADYQEGHRYEIINGRLYVSPLPNFSDDWYERFIAEKLATWARRHSDVIGWVSTKPRVFVHSRQKTTAPEPDIAAFRDRPASPDADWRTMSPLIVVEVMKKDWKKDLVRNVELYREIPSVLEYWIVDIRKDVNDPKLIVFRRDSGDDDWTKTDYPADAVYKTPLLRGFKLPVTPQW
jgi:Uma2 family endonuclease